MLTRSQSAYKEIYKQLKTQKKTKQAARHQAGFCRCSHGRSKPILGGVPCGNRFINCTKAVIRRAYAHTRPAGPSDAATAAFRGHLVRHALRWGWRVGSILRDAMCVRIDGCIAAPGLCSKSNHEVRYKSGAAIQPSYDPSESARSKIIRRCLKTHVVFGTS